MPETTAPTPAPTRREFLESAAAESSALATRLFDWRAALIGLLLSGVGVFAVIGVHSPLPTTIILVGYTAALIIWTLQRHRNRSAIHARLMALHADTSVPADSSNTAGLPLAFLSPVDAADLDTLDRLLFFRPAERRAIAADVAVPVAGQLLTLAGGAVALICGAGILFTFVADGLSGASLSAEAWLVCAGLALGAIPGYLLMSEVTGYQDLSRKASAHNADIAEIMLPALAAAQVASGEGPYTTGHAIHWDGTHYNVDRTKLTASAVKPWIAKLRRVLQIVVVVGSIIAATAAVILLALGPI